MVSAEAVACPIQASAAKLPWACVENGVHEMIKKPIGNLLSTRNRPLALVFTLLAASQAVSPVHALEPPKDTPTGQQSAAVGNPTHATVVTWLAKLGVKMLQNQLDASPERNHIVSAVSLVSALGMLHAGTVGASADELSDLLAPENARQSALQTDVPALFEAVLTDVPVLSSANRIWVEQSLLEAVPSAYIDTARKRYQADAERVAFKQDNGKAATSIINEWAAQHTGQRIQSLLPEGAVNAESRVVLTNALHFRDAWRYPFDETNTVKKSFKGQAEPVVTMVTDAQVMIHEDKEITTYQIALDDPRFVFTVAMHASGQTPPELLGSLASAASHPEASAFCRLELPKFALEPQSMSLKPWLQSQHVTTVFGDAADFSPLLGEAAKGVKLDAVYQSAGIEVQEHGVQAVAATAAVVTSRGILPQPAKVCAVDRPFVFAIMHKASGLPLFLGRVVSP